MDITRRQFAWTAAAVAGAPGSTLSARQAIERLQTRLGVPWRTPTVDTFKAGDPDTAVRGIATTFMATFDVLRRAAAAGRNLVITHEPTFYSHEDQTTQLAADAVFQAKRDFIAAHQLVVFRFHDHLHARKPDFVFDGLAASLGFKHSSKEEDQSFYKLPPITLGELANQSRTRLSARAARVVGDPDMSVSRVTLNPGYTSFQAVQSQLTRSDVLIAGEMREWEGVEYTQDAASAGMKKGLILLGHQISEEPGMKLCADWLRSILPEVPVDWISAREPFTS